MGARVRLRAEPVSPAHAGIDRRGGGQDCPSFCLPRPRGDRPSTVPAGSGRKRSPPPTRGSTAAAVAAVSAGRVSPAHAGIDPLGGLRRHPRRGLPRPRGDRPWWIATLIHTANVSPAHAGIDPAPKRIGVPPGCLPRPRGDRPRIEELERDCARSPPPTRGSTGALWHRPPPDRVSPAHAGIDHRSRRAPAAPAGLPRPRGDRPPREYRPPLSTLSPPPTRGSTAMRKGAKVDRGVSPAHAGIDPSLTMPRHSRRRLPRPRGDRPPPVASRTACSMSPPPTRGSTGTQASRTTSGRVSPAHAGIDRLRARRRAWPGRLPRPRGDRPRFFPSTMKPFTSPPPTRGSTRAEPVDCFPNKVSPAHAGIDRHLRRPLRVRGRLPRPRGDRPGITFEQVEALRSPPPTRGSTSSRSPLAWPSSVSPAHAGIDLASSTALQSSRGLPRPRGDRPGIRVPPDWRAESPPPTRGSTRRAGGAPQIKVVSPAHAGIDRPGIQPSPPRWRLPRPRGDRPR